MERRSFIKGAATLTAASAVAGPLHAATPLEANKEIFEFRVYSFTSSSGVSQLKNFVTGALIPLAGKFGVMIGAFSEYSLEEPPKIYLLFCYPDMVTFLRLRSEIDNNPEFLEAAKPYLASDPATPVFTRYETYLMEAFASKPKLEIPDKSRGLLELRTYESYNEDAAKRKIVMFNNEEMPLFEKVGLHSAFFGKILAGPQMPALMYMLWFKDMDERAANWAKFQQSPEWNAMRAKPEYANTVSKVNKKFLLPLDYSQI
jgi:hypothetical protein